MDRIEQLMKAAKPQVERPAAAPGSDAIHSLVHSTDPHVVPLALHAQPLHAQPLHAPTRHARARHAPARRTAARAAAATVLVAAAVVGAVVVGGNLVSQPLPGPAQSGLPTPAVSAGTPPSTTTAPPASAPASAPASPPPAVPPTAPATTAALATGGVACIPANIDQLRIIDQLRSIEPIPPAQQAYYTVLGCADGWLAYSISDEGVKALQLDGGNAWFRIARLQNGRFLWDGRQEWAVVFNWEFQAMNNQGLTARQAMDQEFARKGIPVGLRPQLVGDGPAAG